MKIYFKKSVLEAARERINRLFNEFEEVIVSFSGGKDSTVTLNITLEIAEKLNKLPLKVLFIDQEAEWKGTIDYVREIMYDKRVEPMWFQMPMVITNNASSFNRYNYCWKEGESWIHEQDPISIKENNYGTIRFHELFTNISLYHFKGKKVCYVAGVRTEETPKRLVALTSNLTYKDITWAKRLTKKEEHYTFYPLYDWSYTDIWKYIHDNKIKYNEVYDKLYSHGTGLNQMRISNLHHETAIQTLMLVQELEPDTWNKLSERIDGASSVKHIKRESFTCPKTLPWMFKDWEEYAIHLSETIIQEQKYKDLLYNKIKKDRILYSKPIIHADFWRKICDTILSSDWDFSKYANFCLGHHVDTYRRFHKNKNGESKTTFKWITPMLQSTKYLEQNEKQIVEDYFNKQKEKYTI